MSTSERYLPSNTNGPASRHAHNSGFNYHGLQVSKTHLQSTITDFRATPSFQLQRQSTSTSSVVYLYHQISPLSMPGQFLYLRLQHNLKKLNHQHYQHMTNTQGRNKNIIIIHKNASTHILTFNPVWKLSTKPQRGGLALTPAPSSHTTSSL